MSDNTDHHAVADRLRAESNAFSKSTMCMTPPDATMAWHVQGVEWTRWFTAICGCVPKLEAGLTKTCSNILAAADPTNTRWDKSQDWEKATKHCRDVVLLQIGLVTLVTLPGLVTAIFHTT